MPNRILKESICTSDDINGLMWIEEVFFYRLIVNCDDYGRFDARPAILKSRLFPLKDITMKQVENLLNKLVTAGMVRVYEYDRQPYLQLVAWEKHQQMRAKRSKYPPFGSNGDDLISDDIICNQVQSNAPVIQSESESESECESVASATARTENSDKPGKHKYGEYGWVRLSDAEYERLVKQYGEDKVMYYIGYVDELAQSTGNKNQWKDWNLTVRKAIRDGWGKYVPSEHEYASKNANDDWRTVW